MWSSLLSTICIVLHSIPIAAADGSLQITEADLKQYDGTDKEKPIYLAINGIIFDVSASPAFYGPGGHYHHFTGKDASRAWVSQCWDSEDQLTWRMDGVDAMFMPRYLDEQVQATADGTSNIEGAETFPEGEMARMAKVVLEKFGKLSKKDLEKRRVADKKEARESVDQSIKYWFDFFKDNNKYSVVGTVVHDETKPKAPELCKEAMDRRPLKGGLLDDIMKAGGSVGGTFGGEKQEPVAAENMPDFVKDAMKKNKKGDAEEPIYYDEEDDGELLNQMIRDEL